MTTTATGERRMGIHRAFVATHAAAAAATPFRQASP
jgi:hypothetical protein